MYLFDFLAWGANATSDEIRGLQSGRIQQYFTDGQSSVIHEEKNSCNQNAVFLHELRNQLQLQHQLRCIL